MLKFIAKCFLTLVWCSTFSCVDPYELPIDVKLNEYLVIEGLINTSASKATVQLSRALNLDDVLEFPKVSGAEITIETRNGESILLTENSPGRYSVNKYFDPETEYRLKITFEEKEYASSYIILTKTPVIDSLNWLANETDFSIRVSNHSTQNGPKHYKFNYIETYEYTSVYNSNYIIKNGAIYYREPDEIIYKCWISKNSKPILLASTEVLAENILSNQTIIKLNKGDKRLWHQYSVLVQQIAIDQSAYNYWSQLKKNTEAEGGLFDPIPFQLKGNIQCISNPEETVLGYFSGGEIHEKRITVKNRELPDGYFGFKTDNCFEEYLEVAFQNSLIGRDIIITNRLQDEFGRTLGYFFSAPHCADCRLEGGSIIKPEFMN